MGDDRRLSRRDLFRGRLRPRVADEPRLGVAPERSGVAPSGRTVRLPIHRPPGAVDEAAFLSGCTRCDACLEACPAGAIVHAPPRFRSAAGTPMIDAHAAACAMCADTPCITACEPGVLTRNQPLKMGVAWIQTMACLAHTGSFCSTCSERCPVPGAIRVDRGRPTIDPDACTGCGTCVHVCPAPSNAIVLMPLADRPTRTGDPSRAAPTQRTPSGDAHVDPA
ncbi:MAG: 4Fe-4S binding protein [Phycisphaerales bacterium]